MTSPPSIFNRELVKKHRTRAASNLKNHDFLLREMASRLCERLEYMKRDFPMALDLGAGSGAIADILAENKKVQTLVQTDISEKLLSKNKGLKIVADEESIPFADNSFDLVASIGVLHLVNDLAGTLLQIRRILKPDGLFLGMLYGGQTLKELRCALENAEIAARGGISPRISPFVDIRDGGMLLNRAGFSLPVVDSEILNVEYTHPLKLMHDLRGMGDSNAMLSAEKNFTPCSLIMLAVDNYFHDFSNENQRINASFELITLTGWKPISPSNK
jgi:SAM-dependent methyltransferase